MRNVGNRNLPDFGDGPRALKPGFRLAMVDVALTADAAYLHGRCVVARCTDGFGVFTSNDVELGATMACCPGLATGMIGATVAEAIGRLVEQASDGSESGKLARELVRRCWSMCGGGATVLEYVVVLTVS